MLHKPSKPQQTDTLPGAPTQYATEDIRAEQMEARLVELDAAHGAELEQLKAVASDVRANQPQPLESVSAAVDADSIREGDTGPATANTPSLTPTQKRFYASEQCEVARRALQELVESPQYNTDSDYYSDNMRSFVDRHLHFLSTHPATNLTGYISNLKLMTNVKSRH